MKNKKLITALASVAMAATLSLTAFAGCQQEEHSYRWKTDKEATCVATGTRTGVCGICGGVVTETIPVDPNNHGYGEWEIVKTPTDTETGTATKTCSYNSAHTLSVTLPELNKASSYKSVEVTVEPTSISEGARTYVYEHEVEDVKFDVAIPKRGLETVGDAVYIGWSNADKIRRATGRRTEAKTLAGGASYHSFSCEYGENYAHIIDDADKTESWYSVDAAGNPFGVTKKDGDDRTVAVDLQANANNIKGVEYMSGGGSFTTYGAEDTLRTYYDMARLNDEKGKAVNYQERLYPANSQNGTRMGEFSYSYYENPNFCRYNVEFTLDKNGIIISLTVQTTVIRAYMIAEDEEGGKLFYEDGELIFGEEYIAYNQLPANDPNYAQSTDPAYERDEKGKIIYDGVKTDKDGNVLLDKDGNEIPRPKPYGKDSSLRTYYSDEHSEVSIREIIFNAPTLKADDPTEPVNPYESENCYLRSFDVRYNNKLVGDEPVTIDSNRQVIFNLENIAPATALLDYDPIELYVRTDEGDKQLTINESDNVYRMIGYCSPERRTVEINVKYAGEITLVLKSRGGLAEKIVKLNVQKGAPSRIYGQAYSYSDAGGIENYSWKGYTLSDGVTVYKGQPILLRAIAGDGEETFADTTVEASCLNSVTGLDDPNIHFTTVERDGETVIQAVADRPGEYFVYLSCIKDGNVFEGLKIIVEDMTASQLAAKLRGEYKATLNYLEPVQGEPRKCELNITFSFTTDYRSGKITVDFEGSTLNFNYRYDEATNVLTSTRVTGDPGYSGGTFEFKFEMNEAYKLTVEYPTSFGFNEKIVLSPVE